MNARDAIASQYHASLEGQGPMRVRTDLQPGDIGSIIRLHGEVYAREYGYDWTFEGYVAAGLAEFAASPRPSANRLWVVESGEHVVGSIGIVGRDDAEAQLRWFLVHPDCRGQGLGRTLLDEALRFCRQGGFRSVYLWTVSDLDAAIHLYRSFGFSRTERKTHPLWGRLLTEERYDLALG